MGAAAGTVAVYGLILVRPWVAGLGSSSRLLLGAMTITQIALYVVVLGLIVAGMTQIFGWRWPYYRRRLRVWRRSLGRKIQRRRASVLVTGEARASEVTDRSPQRGPEGSSIPIQQPAED